MRYTNRDCNEITKITY